jgi:hypothetical protein
MFAQYHLHIQSGLYNVIITLLYCSTKVLHININGNIMTCLMVPKLQNKKIMFFFLSGEGVVKITRSNFVSFEV